MQAKVCVYVGGCVCHVSQSHNLLELCTDFHHRPSPSYFLLTGEIPSFLSAYKDQKLDKGEHNTTGYKTRHTKDYYLLGLLLVSTHLIGKQILLLPISDLLKS